MTISGKWYDLNAEFIKESYNNSVNGHYVTPLRLFFSNLFFLGITLVVLGLLTLLIFEAVLNPIFGGIVLLVVITLCTGFLLLLKQHRAKRIMDSLKK